MTIKTITVTTSAQLNAALKAATGGETIVLSGSHKFTLTATDLNPASNVTITSANPNAMSTIATASLTRSSNIVIDSVKFDSSGVTRADWLSDLNITDSKNVALINSVMTGTATAFNDGTAVVGDTAINISGSTGVVVAGNLIQNYFRGLLGSASSNVILEGNEMTKIQGDGMQFTTMNTLLIKDNHLHDFLGSAHSRNHDDMIQFWTAGSTTPSKNITITGNILDSGNGAASQTIFFGNEVATANPANTAMYYQNLVIDNNFIRNGEGNGISVAYVNGLKITNNAVLYDHDAAHKAYNTGNILIKVAGVATNAVVSGNVADAYSLLASIAQSNNTKAARGTDGSSLILASYYPDKSTPVVGVDKPATPAPAPSAPAGGGTGSTVQGTANADTLTGTANADVVRGGAGNDRISGLAGADQLFGDDGNDHILGGDGNDVIRGGNGNDTVYGGSGADTIHGDAGDDLLYGEDGNDTIHGGGGNDGVRAGAGNDVVYGGAGSDTIYGDAGDDLLYGDDGNDIIHGGDGSDGIRAGSGNDTVNGGGGNDTIFGDAGNDVLNGDAGNDTISGGDGDDKLSGGAGRDMLTGGAGLDQFIFNTALDGNTDTITDFNPAQDKIVLDTGIFAALAGKTLTASMLRIGSTAQDSNDYLIYNNGTLYYDPDGNGAQAARAIATLSNKASLSIANFLTGSGAAKAAAAPEAAVETDSSPAPVATPAPVPSAPSDSPTGTAGADTLSGGSGSDVLMGLAGNDVLHGRGGSDWLHGGPGRDTLTGGAGNDVFVFDTKPDGNIDTITDFSGVDRIGLDVDVFTAFADRTISADNLRIGGVAQDSNDFLLYVNGVLYYDADGNGAQKAQAIAALSNGAALTHGSFLLL